MTAFSKMTLASAMAAFLILPNLVKADYCDAQSDPDAYPRWFNWAGQVYGDPSSDFLYIPGDLTANGDLDDLETVLLTLIFEHLAAQGTSLAIVVPAPRLVTTSEAYGVTRAQVDAIEDGYGRFLTQLESIGIIAPNVVDFLDGEANFLANYNLPKDIHWSPLGAMSSALALRADVIGTGILDLDFLGSEFFLGPLEEFSLSGGGMTRALGEVCNVEFEPDTVHYSTVEPANNSGSLEDLLFADTSSKFEVLLVGSSFTNKGGADDLRWSDAIRFALQVDPINIGVPGGELYTSMQHYALNQDKYGAPDLLVWEAIWVSRRKSWADDLRLIYGELLGACTSGQVVNDADLRVDERWTELFFSQTNAEKLSFVVPGLETGRVMLRLTYPDGGQQQIRLVRLDGALEHPEWTVFLGGLNGQSPEKIEFQVIGQTEPMSISASLCAAQH